MNTKRWLLASVAVSCRGRVLEFLIPRRTPVGPVPADRFSVAVGS